MSSPVCVQLSVCYTKATSDDKNKTSKVRIRRSRRRPLNSGLIDLLRTCGLHPHASPLFGLWPLTRLFLRCWLHLSHSHRYGLLCFRKRRSVDVGRYRSVPPPPMVKKRPKKNDSGQIEVNPEHPFSVSSFPPYCYVFPVWFFYTFPMFYLFWFIFCLCWVTRVSSIHYSMQYSPPNTIHTLTQTRGSPVNLPYAVFCPPGFNSYQWVAVFFSL